jgi:hypothetical protein
LSGSWLRFVHAGARGGVGIGHSHGLLHKVILKGFRNPAQGWTVARLSRDGSTLGCHAKISPTLKVVASIARICVHRTRRPRGRQYFEQPPGRGHERLNGPLPCQIALVFCLLPSAFFIGPRLTSASQTRNRLPRQRRRHPLSQPETPLTPFPNRQLACPSLLTVSKVHDQAWARWKELLKHL